MQTLDFFDRATILDDLLRTENQPQVNFTVHATSTRNRTSYTYWYQQACLVKDETRLLPVGIEPNSYITIITRQVSPEVYEAYWNYKMNEVVVDGYMEELNAYNDWMYNKVVRDFADADWGVMPL